MFTLSYTFKTKVTTKCIFTAFIIGQSFNTALEGLTVV